MSNHIISIFSIYDAAGHEITTGLQLAQALAIKAYSGCIIKFTSFKEVAA